MGEWPEMRESQNQEFPEFYCQDKKVTWPFRAFLRMLTVIVVCFCPGLHSAVLVGSSLSGCAHLNEAVGNQTCWDDVQTIGIGFIRFLHFV